MREAIGRGELRTGCGNERWVRDVLFTTPASMSKRTLTELSPRRPNFVNSAHLISRCVAFIGRDGLDCRRCIPLQPIVQEDACLPFLPNTLLRDLA
jgi:hypothetical protein